MTESQASFQYGSAPCRSPICLWAATRMTWGISLGHFLLKLKSGCLYGRFDVLIPVFKISRRDFEPFINNLLKQRVLGVAQSPHISRHLVKMSENLTLIADKCVAWLKIYATSMHVTALLIPVSDSNTIPSMIPTQVSVVLLCQCIIFPLSYIPIPNTSCLFYHDQ